MFYVLVFDCKLLFYIALCTLLYNILYIILYSYYTKKAEPREIYLLIPWFN